MREPVVFGIIASVVLAATGFVFFGRPYLYRRGLRTAEEEVKVLVSKQELTAASKSNKTTDK